MIFRRNQGQRTGRTRADFPQIEYAPMSLAELKVYERVILTAERAVAANRFDIPVGTHKTELIGHFYAAAGAASVRTTDADRVRIPIQRGDFFWLEHAIADLERYRWNADLAQAGRQLLWRLNALLGRERAVIHAGGTPMFDPDRPSAVVVDSEDQAVPVDLPELPPVTRHG